MFDDVGCNLSLVELAAGVANVCVCVHASVCVYVCVCVWICVFVYMWVCIYICILVRAN